MKKVFLSALLLTGFALTGIAQSWGYAREGHWVQDIDEAADESVFAIGLSWSDPGFYYASNFVVKLDSNGEEVWSNNGDGMSFEYFTGINIFATADGGAIVTGVSDYYTPGAYELLSDGSIGWDSDSWSSGLGFSYIYQGTACMLTDGRIVMAGLLDDLTYRFLVMDQEGNLLSDVSYEPDTTGWAWSYYDYKETGICATSDGGFAFSTGHPGYRTVMKYSSDIELEWLQDYPHLDLTWEYGQFHNGLSQASDGGYLLAGSMSDAIGQYAGTLRKIDADGNLEWVTTLNHGAEWEEGAHAIELTPGNYLVWTQDAGDNSTHAWVLDADGSEIDSVFIPIINCSWGFGATGMELWSVKNASDGGYYIAGRQYLEDCSQRFTVLKSNEDGSFDDCIFNCVWPGDADNDGLVDANDLFEIGINYGATGFTRDDTGIDWDGKLSRAWMEEDTLYWFVLNDLKYTDCDGNGAIDENDTTAVLLNWGLDHPLNVTRTSAGEIPLFFDPAVTSLNLGLNQIPIYLGNESDFPEAIYGIAFSISSESEHIDRASLRIRFTDSWMASDAERIAISKASETETLVSGAMVRNTRANTTGFGQIAVLDVVVIDNLAGKLTTEEIDLNIQNAKAILLNRDEIVIDAQGATFNAEISTPDEVNELVAAGFTLFPNPSTGNMVQLQGQSFDMAELIDVTGRIVRTYSNGSNQLSIEGIAPGTYSLRVTHAHGTSVGSLVVQ